MQEWIDDDVDIKNFNDTLPTAKTASLAKYKARITAVLEALPHLINFYVLQPRVRRLDFHTFICSQRTVDLLCNRITAGNPYTIVGFGDAALSRNVWGTVPVS